LINLLLKNALYYSLRSNNQHKTAGHEMKAFECLWKAQISTEDGNELRNIYVSPLAIADYRGEKLNICMNLPIGSDTLRIGSQDGGVTFASGGIGHEVVRGAMRALGTELNLAEHIVGRGSE